MNKTAKIPPQNVGSCFQHNHRRRLRKWSCYTLFHTHIMYRAQKSINSPEKREKEKKLVSKRWNGIKNEMVRKNLCVQVEVDKKTWKKFFLPFFNQPYLWREEEKTFDLIFFSIQFFSSLLIIQATNFVGISFHPKSALIITHQRITIKCCSELII